MPIRSRPVMSTSPPTRFYLISYPRTTSNLLLKILALDDQPNVSTGSFDSGYFFVPVSSAIARLQLEARNVDAWSASEAREVRDVAQQCFRALSQCVEDAEAKGHRILIKEHTVYLAEPVALSRFRFGDANVRSEAWTVEYPRPGGREEGSLSSPRSSSNFTWLPDEFLLEWRPIFLIRHPVLAFPSYYRTIVKTDGREATEKDDFAAFVINVQWTRSLYDFYVQESGHAATDWPVIVDADDILVSPDIVERLCERMGMDRNRLRFNWEQTQTDDVQRRVMRSTLYESTSIVAGKTSAGLDVDTESVRWKDEFGDVAAQHIAKMVRESMPHYTYLKEKRLRPDNDSKI